MGLINQDPVRDTRSGQDILNTYINIGSIAVNKNSTAINISFPVILYYSKDARLANYFEIATTHVTIDATIPDMETPLYTFIYNYVKTNLYTNTIDDL